MWARVARRAVLHGGGRLGLLFPRLLAARARKLLPKTARVPKAAVDQLKELEC